MNLLTANQTPLLAVENLCRSFGGVSAVDHVSFNVERGELLALLGPNGAGKSTCFNLINGQLRADSGQVLFEGEPLSGLSPRAIWRLGISRTFQIAATFSTLSALENVQMALLSKQRALFSLSRAVMRRQREEAYELLGQVGMQAEAERPCGVLAYGDVKRVELAIALASRPRLLLMDEPTAGMGPVERHELMALTKRLVKEHQMGVLFTEHSMDVVFAHADRMVVLARGQLIAMGSGSEIRDDAKVQEVYFGRSRAFDSSAHEARP
jgi:branched-chain amino acid transport system ATP-binding protein